jgi:hypothetical protein
VLSLPIQREKGEDKMRLKLKKTKVVVIAAVLLFLVFGVYFYYSARPASSLDNEWESGLWRQDMDLVLSDGSTVPIDLSGKSPKTQEYFYQGLEFIGINYTISAKATSTDYASIAIDYNEYQITFAFAYFVYNETFTAQDYSIIYPDGNWYEITHFYIAMSTIAPGFNSVGAYDFSVTPNGVVLYNPDNTEWYTATLPVSVTLQIQNRGHLTFELGDESNPLYTTDIFRPSSDGTPLTLSVQPSGTHYTTVNEASPNDDTNYVYRRGTNSRNDFYRIPVSDPAHNNGVIASVTVFGIAKSIQGTVRYQLGVYPSGGTASWGPQFSASTQKYNVFLQTWYLNPADGLAWEWSDIDTLSIGCLISGQTSSSEGRFTQIFCVVKYSPVI